MAFVMSDVRALVHQQRLACSRLGSPTPVRSMVWGPASRRPARVHASVQYQTDPGLPPPPPPPPPPAATTRRGVLQYAGLGAAALLGGVTGYFLGSRSSGSAQGGLTAAERAEVDELRGELHFRRDYDGHVFVQDGRGQWWEVRLDAKLPGTLLLRDPQNNIWFITYQNLQQIDLTDDYTVGSLFVGGDWESLAQRVQIRNDAGQLEDVQLPKEAFRDLISVLQ